MKSSTRSKFGAAAVFASIAVVVIGGMAWATVVTLELAKKTVKEDYDGKIIKAVGLIDGYMGGIRASETMRNYKDYKPYYEMKPLMVWTRDGAEVSDTTIVLKSDLFENGSPHDWIDLYFQVGSDGGLTSPQVLDVPVPWLSEGVKGTDGCEPRTCRTWDWLIKVLPTVNLDAIFGDDDLTRSAAQLASENANPSLVRATDRQHAHEPYPAYADQRRKSLRDDQVGKRLPPDCVEPDIATSNITSRSVYRDSAETNSPFEGRVEIKPGDFAKPFWVKPAPADEPKLAFVRECTADAAVFYQGFIGDWNQLKRVLLEQVAGLGLFAEADLVPVPPSADQTVGTMFNLPVRLSVPGIPDGAAGAAWKRVRGTLLVSWLAAISVLVVAGVGLRNLVMLTERRTQFAYAVTHELRTPLTTFRLYSDMLAAELVPEPKKREYLSTLNRESQRLSALVEDVLEYARLENRNVRLNPIEIKASSLLSAITESMETRCQANGLQGHAHDLIDNGLAVRTDVDLVQRIAGVLVSNACRHACGSEGAGVYVELSGDEHHVHLDVSDTGPGVARPDHKNIFKPFRRGRKAEHTAQGGIGLGLALARDWATLLGGKLELVERHHTRHGGAHFRLTIPTELAT